MESIVAGSSPASPAAVGTMTSSGALQALTTRQLAATLVPALCVLAVMLLVHSRAHVLFAHLTRDMAAIANVHPLTGLLSNLGIILWCVSAAVCLFAALLLRRGGSREEFLFLLFAGLLSAYLLLDDFFQFHEVLADRYLGLDEKVVYAALGLGAAAHLVAFRKVILRTRFGLLVLAFAFLATSVAIDEITEMLALRLGDWEYFFEDGAKWLGIACWCGYYLDTAQLLLWRSFSRPAAAAALS